MFTSIRSRITLAMASLVALLAVASGIAMREVVQLEALSTQVAGIDDAVRRLHKVAIAMRDAYAHQAHVVLLNDRSHLDHYGETHEAALAAVAAARAVLTDTEDLQRLAGIGQVVIDLDAAFRADLLPHVPSKTNDPQSAAKLAAAHDKAIHLVENGQAKADALTGRLNAQAGDVRVDVQASRERLFGRCAALFAAAVLLAVVVAVLLDRQISVPVRALQTAVRRVGEGNLQTRVEFEGDHELASLARHFNEMAGELQERERRLLEAERLAGVGRLAAGVAHEINNPLGVMLGYVRLIERTATQERNDVINADAAMIRVEIERCQRIVAGLLDLARPPRLALTSVDLVGLVTDAATSLPMTPDGGARVHIGGDETATAVIDEGKVLQVLRNLFANALDAAPDGAIDAVVKVYEDQVVVTVTDDGAGLSNEARTRLFEPFFTSKPRGSGLGLAVSRTFAEAHGGALHHVDNAAAGARGATFQLTLPRQPPVSVAPTARAGAQERA